MAKDVVDGIRYYPNISFWNFKPFCNESRGTFVLSSVNVFILFGIYVTYILLEARI